MATMTELYAVMERAEIRNPTIIAAAAKGRSKMAEYHAIYKCRLCGEHYDSAATGSRELAINETTLLCLGIKGNQPQAPQMTEVHLCKNGNIGIADFKGWIKKAGANNG